MSSMKLYKLNPNLWPKNRDKLLRTNAIVFVLGLSTGILIALSRMLAHPELILRVLILDAPVFVVMALIYGLIVYRKVKLAKRRYDSYELRIDDETIERIQFSMPQLLLKRSEVV